MVKGTNRETNPARHSRIFLMANFLFSRTLNIHAPINANPTIKTPSGFERSAPAQAKPKPYQAHFSSLKVLIAHHVPNVANKVAYIALNEDGLNVYEFVQVTIPNNTGQKIQDNPISRHINHRNNKLSKNKEKAIIRSIVNVSKKGTFIKQEFKYGGRNPYT
jgi:hypothetical protein